MKVGDYVRTKKGIGKITEYEKHDSWGYIIKVEGTYNCYTHTGNGELSDVIKSSPNIIDVIEVGDLVNYEQLNGGLVLNKRENEIDTWALLPNKLKNEDIKSVITREQLIANQYKVGE